MNSGIKIRDSNVGDASILLSTGTFVTSQLPIHPTTGKMSAWCENPVELRPPPRWIEVRVLKRYLVTESLQLPNQSLRVCLAGSLPVEIILAELLIGHFALQHVVADHQDRVPDCHRRFLRTMPASEASVLRRKVAPLGARCSALADSVVSALRSHLEPLRVLPERRLPADSSLPGHIPAPRSQVAVGGKLAHVHPDLCDQSLSHPAVDARDGVEEFDLL
jgi:hypothetical protein